MNILLGLKIVSFIAGFALVVTGLFNLPFDDGFIMIGFGFAISFDAAAWLIVIEKIEEVAKR